MVVSKLNDYNKRRVVVTGMGVISSLGIGWQEFWKNLIAGKSGITKVTSFDTSNHDRHYGGEVKDFDPTKFIPRRRIPFMGRSSQMAVAASKLALEDAKLSLEDIRGKKVGVCIGTTMGESILMERLIENVV